MTLASTSEAYKGWGEVPVLTPLPAFRTIRSPELKRLLQAPPQVPDPYGPDEWEYPSASRQEGRTSSRGRSLAAPSPEWALSMLLGLGSVVASCLWW